MILENRLTKWVARRLRHRCFAIIAGRQPDFVVERSNGAAYLRRWWVIPRNRWFNIYLHQFMLDDEDRALHDHPWPSLSISVATPMREIYLGRDGVEREREVRPGMFVWRGPRFTHRMVVPTPGAVTLFITGARVREWGFHCGKGWMHWKKFTTRDGSGRARGCGEMA